MRRKKSAKRSTMQQNVNKKQPQATEKDFFDLPAKLAAQAGKEVAALKRNETNLLSSLKKATAQLKKADAQMKAAGKTKNSSSGKKQFLAAKKMMADLSKSITTLTKDLKAASYAVVSADQKQSKMLALSKMLAKFDKDWSKQSKMKTKTKPAAKKRKRKLALVQSKPSTQDQSNVENYSPEMENDSLNQVAESS
jgi:hypothetical protein